MEIFFRYTDILKRRNVQRRLELHVDSDGDEKESFENAGNMINQALKDLVGMSALMNKICKKQ